LPNPTSVTSDDKRTYRGIQEGIHPSPVVQLNRAVVIAMCDGPEAGLAHIDAVLDMANWQIITRRIQPCRYVPQARQDS